MAWSFINQLIRETLSVRTQLLRQTRGSFLLKQDIVVITGLLSFKSHRLFGIMELNGRADVGSVLKVVPSDIQDYCSDFLIAGLNTKMSEFSLIVPTRQFFDRCDLTNLVHGSSGNIFFLLGSIRRIISFLNLFFKTRQVIFLQASLFNQLRKRFYCWSVETLLGSWKTTFLIEFKVFFFNLIRFPLYIIIFFSMYLFFVFFNALLVVKF